MLHLTGVPSCGGTGVSHVQETSQLGMESVSLRGSVLTAHSSKDPTKLLQQIHAVILTSWYLRGGENEEIKEAGRKGKHQFKKLLLSVWENDTRISVSECS